MLQQLVAGLVAMFSIVDPSRPSPLNNNFAKSSICLICYFVSCASALSRYFANGMSHIAFVAVHVYYYVYYWSCLD